MEKQKYEMILTKREKILVELCRKIDFGEIELTVHDGKPHLFRKITKNIRLDIIDLDN